MGTIKDLIEALRNLPLSQQEISRRTGIPQPRLSRWGAGKATDIADDALKIRALHAQLVADKPASKKAQKPAKATA